MKSTIATGWLVVALAACGAPATVTTAPTPAPTPAPGAPAASAPAATLKEAPANWQLLDPTADGVPGISAERAYRELLAGKSPKRTVIVAVIDGGVDTAHADLRANLWENPRENHGNGKDDDGNGYVDDVRGWDFIGGADGKDVHWDTFEVTRLVARCNGDPAAGALGQFPPAERGACADYQRVFDSTKTDYQQQMQNIAPVAAAVDQMLPVLKRVLGDSITRARVEALQSNESDVRQARNIYLRLAALGATPEQVLDARKELSSRLQYGLNTSFDPRPLVGDDYRNLGERRYGNSDVMGPDAEHGTHVAGIIGAVRGNGVGIDGIATGVKILAVRAVPDGDERDKDIANAIRYAVDQGANVINMSFGKAYSPQKSVVDEAVKYADSKGVLMIHAAGNDAQDLSRNNNYPSPVYLTGGRAQNWIEVGASSWKGGADLAATFSNYGAKQVDVFAPGVDILSTVPGGKYERNSGTSMAAPVVTGLAALVMAYYPNLTAADVRRIIIASVTKLGTTEVTVPGAEGSRVPFSTLSVSGGVVNAYNALQMAAQASRTTP